jgi:dipeptidase E
VRRLLLLSNSTNHGGSYLDHAMERILAFLGPRRRLAFVPFALHDHEGYTAKVRDRFAPSGVEVEGITLEGSTGLENAEALFVGGGNTFRLLDRLQRRDLLGAIRERVGGGMPYLAASAGTNVACPTIRTTNDMPIVEPATFEALALVPFQINTHYLDPDPASRHMGETREERIGEYLEENDSAVLGLREGSWVAVEDEVARLEGPRPARLFRRDREPEELSPGADVREALAR